MIGLKFFLLYICGIVGTIQMVSGFGSDHDSYDLNLLIRKAEELTATHRQDGAVGVDYKANIDDTNDIDEEALGVCISDYKESHSHEMNELKELIEDYMWFENIFNSDLDICSKLSFLWEHIDTDPTLYNNVTMMIEEKIHVNLNSNEYEIYGIDSDIIDEIGQLFTDFEDNLLQQRNVTVDLAFHALKWLMQRKTEYQSIFSLGYCARVYGSNSYSSGDDNTDHDHDHINAIAMKSLLNILHECVLFEDDHDTSTDTLYNDLQLNPVKFCEQFLNNSIKTSLSLAIEATLEIGVIIVFEGGFGIFLKVSKVTVISAYGTFSIGIGIDVELDLLEIGVITFEPGYDGHDLMDSARFRLTLGIQLVIGIEYSWIWSDSFDLIGHEYMFGVGIGIQIPAFRVYVKNGVVHQFLSVNLTAACENLARPTGPPTTTPPTGTQNLFDTNHRNFWTSNAGAWTNITGVIGSVTNNDGDGEYDTLWVGDDIPSSLQWQNYAISVKVKIMSSDSDGSAGFIFGAASDATTSYYLGAYEGYVVFGTFDSSNAFTQVNVWSQSSVTLNSVVPFSASFLTNTGDSSADVNLMLNGVSLGSYSNLTTSLQGSVGLRTIKTTAQYTQCKVSFNQTSKFVL